MAPRKLYLENQKASTKGTKAFIDAGVVKRRHKKVRFHEKTNRIHHCYASHQSCVAWSSNMRLVATHI